MRGDRLVIGDHHRRAAKTLTDILVMRSEGCVHPLVVSIAGESGSGKSELAVAIADSLQHRHMPSLILQQDDYFVLPPRSNDRKRREDITWVGPQEVHLDRLDGTLRKILAGAETITKPLVFYNEDRIGEDEVCTTGIRVVLVEGTYTSLLEAVDLRVFIDRTVDQTRTARSERAREAQDAFLESVLQLEHDMISRHKNLAHILITSDYSVKELVPES